MLPDHAWYIDIWKYLRHIRGQTYPRTTPQYYFPGLTPNPFTPSSHIRIQITLITTSKPLLSPPSYLKLHIPSVLSFQYAPVALCIPLLPTCGLPSVPVASLLMSLAVITASSASGARIELSWAAFARLRAEVGTKCWMMVLLTAYLYAGDPPGGDDSEMRDRSIEFCDSAVSKEELG